MATPLVGALAMSEAPRLVPMDAVTAPVKVGVSVDVSLCAGEMGEAEMDAVAAATTVTVVEADLLESSLEVAVMIAVPAVGGAVQTPVLGSIEPAVADQEMPFVTPFAAVVLKVVEVLTVLLGAAGEIVLTTTVCGVRVTDASTASPATFVTWRK